MKIVAGIPASRAAQATACPWFPALAATTPARRSVSPRVAIVLKAPLILNDPVRWRFSSFRKTGRPDRREKVSLGYSGVSRATPASRSRAASTSAIVGAIDLEHLLEYLPHGTQRVELA